MSCVLVFGELQDGSLAQSSLQVAAAGTKLARALGLPLAGALFGTQLAQPAAEFRCGLDALHLLQSDHLKPYNGDVYMAAVEVLIRSVKPAVVLFVQGAPAREWVPRLAARMRAGLVMNSCAVEIEQGTLMAFKPVNGGMVLAKLAVSGEYRFVMVRASDFELPQTDGVPETRWLEWSPSDSPREKILSEEFPQELGRPRLKNAKVVVAGGRGVGGQANWHFIDNAASVLNAAIGCSRPVAESGWLESSTHQVGLSGASVSPDLYIAVGISGAPQHLAGISAAKTVVAINNDPEAQIFKRADLGVVGDFQEILPGFIDQVKRLRG